MKRKRKKKKSFLSFLPFFRNKSKADKKSDKGISYVKSNTGNLKEKSNKGSSFVKSDTGSLYERTDKGISYMKSDTGHIYVKSNTGSIYLHSNTGKIAAEPEESDDPFRRPIIGITVFFAIIFVSLMGYFTVYAMTHEQELMDNSYNSRQTLFSTRIKRGTIYAATGEKLAVSNIAADGSEERIYPYGNLYSHSVGFIGRGRTGVEALANYYLLKSDIPELEKVQFEVLGEKAPGDNVYITLDAYLQEVAERALGLYRGAIIATEPDTGRVLCMVSKPDFDPGSITELWDELLADEESGRLVNRVTQGMYPPGSTFKIVTALEYLREHNEDYSGYSYTCSGSFKQGEDVIRCYHGSVHGSVDMEKSFAKSCNSSFANMSVGFDKEKYGATLNKLLFNGEMDIPFAYNKSSAVVDSYTDISDVMQTAIGQGRVQISPLHLNMITGAVANGGVMMRPMMIDRVENANGELVEMYEPSELARVMTAGEADSLKTLMTGVVNSGTGTKLKGLSYTAAGKTGSAEFDSRTHDSHAWFTGFAPADNPKIAITVIIEGAGSGGDYAVPTAKTVLDAYFGK